MKNLIVMLASLFLLSGCATIVDTAKGKTQKIYFTTPTGKSVIAMIGGQKVTIPAVIEVKKSTDTTISVFTDDNPKYRNYVGTLSALNPKETAPAWWFNVPFLTYGLSGSLTDNATGSTYQYSQPIVIIPVDEK